MSVKINDDAVAAIEAILKRGNKAVVQRKERGIIILEEKREIKYRNTPPSGEEQRAI